MTLKRPTESPWVRQQLRVPRNHGALFIRPAWGTAVPLVDQNRQALSEAGELSLQGRPLHRMREWTRREVLRAAVAYTEKIRGETVSAPPDLASPLIVGGHQPALFHPGVWAKNFAVDGLAGACQGIGLHLVVDNDTLASTRINIPAGDRSHPSFSTLPIDVDHPAQPWEEARILDSEQFASFGERAAQAMQPWGVVPVAKSIWPQVAERCNAGSPLRDALTMARHLLERRWGLQNLELPLSQLSELEPFYWFVAHILAHLPRFREVHNTILGEYRRVNRVRSRTHPVADLRAQADWLEAPFWVWRPGDRVRGRLMARQQGREIVLSDGREEFLRLPLAPDREACCAVEALRTLPEHGIRLRTRALTTTLFARTLLADLFVHGIGGAKYDEMTDRLFTRFYGISAPEFLTVSATVHLPIGPPFDVVPDDVRRLRGLLRDLRLNPSRHLTRGHSADVDALLAAKQLLVEEERADRETPVDMGSRRARHRARAARTARLRGLTEQLATATQEQQRAVAAELAEVEQQLAANRILKSRDYSFALFPEGRLREALCRFQDVPPG